MLRTFSFSQFKQEYDSTSSWSDLSFETDKVRKIIGEVRKRGDEALIEYTSQFDGVFLSELAVTEEEFHEAINRVEPELQQAIKESIHNIEQFHSRQLPRSFRSSEDDDGIILGQIYLPLEKVGAYVPGGTAAYPSSVLMTVVPACVAGVDDVYICTPPDSDGKVNPVTLFAAREAGATKVFKLGGVQAVAALAYGTESVPRVQKIVGPGNTYVTLAKKEVFGDVGIDMLAGPSEIMIVADSLGKPDYIAADLLSQAEHGPSSRSYLITTDAELSQKVQKELAKQLPALSRKGIAETSLREQGGIILVDNLQEAWEIVNMVAPEHLEIHLEDPCSYLENVKNASSIFLGPYSPEALGDYWAGVNHVLPTGGAARFASPLGVNDFFKYSQVMFYSREAFHRVASGVESFARVEGLDAHARSILIRGTDQENETNC